MYKYKWFSIVSQHSKKSPFTPANGGRGCFRWVLMLVRDAFDANEGGDSSEGGRCGEDENILVGRGEDSGCSSQFGECTHSLG
jgi:hypothetical protein